MSKEALEAWGRSEEGRTLYHKVALKVDATLQQLWDDSDVRFEVRQNRWGKPYWHFEIL